MGRKLVLQKKRLDISDKMCYTINMNGIRVLRIDGTESSLVDEGLTGLQAAVGGFIELVNLSNGDRLWINEDGRRLKLPVNAEASRLCGFQIVGNVVLVPISGMN